ncbi:MAG: outer membrane beta-barrel protein [Bdellovibrionales bacterium]|nr:porin [Bdellovibrionales bacterium]NQZ18131.1 outer membrane beta-barrel protein [Bdellovibrionales bacterium]
MGNKIIIAILASLAFVSTAFAGAHDDGDKKPFSISGDFAGSLMFHDNEANYQAGAGQNPHDEFNVNLIEINLEKNWSKSSLNLSIGYGNTAAFVNALGTQSANTLNVMNAYYSMNTSYGLTFMFGKWEAPFGIETYNHTENAQYTRSYGFLLTPFFQTGLGVNYNGGMWDAGLIASNGRGQDTDTGDNNKTLALTVGVNPMDNLAIDLNYITGTEGTAVNTPASTHAITVLDLSVAFMLNEMLDFAVNYTGRTNQAQSNGAQEFESSSIAAYVNANFGMFGLGLRYEQFSYDGGALAANGLGAMNFGPNGITGTDNSINSITLAAKAEIDQNANVVLEYRTDSSDDQIWADKDGQANDSQNTITLGLMYTF